MDNLALAKRFGPLQNTLLDPPLFSTGFVSELPRLDSVQWTGVIIGLLPVTASVRLRESAARLFQFHGRPAPRFRIAFNGLARCSIVEGLGSASRGASAGDL